MKVHFDGDPDRVARLRALFNQQSTLRVRYADPVDRKFRWSKLHAKAERLLAKIRRAA